MQTRFIPECVKIKRGDLRGRGWRGRTWRGRGWRGKSEVVKDHTLHVNKAYIIIKEKTYLNKEDGVGEHISHITCI